MKKELSLMNRRMLVGANYVAVILVLVFFHLGETRGWDPAVASVTIMSLLIALISFVVVHLKTHLWKMSHARPEKLDEREFQVIHGALGHSYSIFVIVCIVILYVLTLAEIKGAGTLGVLLPGSLLYLAHSLPSAVLAWTEKEVQFGPA